MMSLRYLAFASLLVSVSAQAQNGAVRYDRAALEASKPTWLEKPAPPDSDFAKQGKAIYLQRCAGCHGESGAGDGLGADVMNPRPRDFTAGNFEFRSTQSGELPTDADLFVAISRGVPGTTMPAWGEGAFRLTDEELWQVTYHVKTLTGIFWDEYTNPYRPADDGYSPIVTFDKPPARTEALVAKGKELFLDDSGSACLRCHGVEGRGDGVAAAEQRDDMGNPIRPSDFTNPWRRKTPLDPKAVFRTLTTGLNGTPMAAFVDGVSEEERWALAYYVDALRESRTVSTGPLKAIRVAGEVPSEPDDAAWEQCPDSGIPLFGQLIVAPRWQASSVDYVRVCALYNDDTLAVLLSWNDPFHDDGSATELQTPDGAGAAPSEEDTQTPAWMTVAAMQARALAKPIVDRVALQMPAGDIDPAAFQRPHMLMGDRDRPVYAMFWSAKGKGEAAEGTAKGAADDYSVQDAKSTQLQATGEYEHGRYRVVFRRAMRTQDRLDAQLTAGDLVPISIRVWDGSAGEHGLQSAMSAWWYIHLEVATPASAYIKAALATALGFGLLGVGWWRLRKT